MTRIWYDPECQQIWIATAVRSEGYQARSLALTVTADWVAVHPKVGTNAIVFAHYSTFADFDGGTFASAADVRDYLNAVFDRCRPLGVHFVQNRPAMRWVIQHDLGFQPSLTLTDTAGDVIEADARYPDGKTVEVTFSAPTAGAAFLS